MGELRYLATDAARDAFAAFRTDAGAETFYAYALTVAPGRLRVGAAANTEEGLLRTAERFAADGYGSVEALAANAAHSLRWRIADWAYAGGAAAFAGTNAWIADAFGDADPGDAPELARELVGALRDLGREDFFGWGPDRDAVVVLLDTGEPEDLLEHARDVNPAAAFARLQAGLGLA